MTAPSADEIAELQWRVLKRQEALLVHAEQTLGRFERLLKRANIPIDTCAARPRVAPYQFETTVGTRAAPPRSAQGWEP